jgi:hypothetical protein
MTNDSSPTSRLRAVAERHPVVVTFTLAVLVTLPAIIAVASTFLEHWYPTGDVSHTELLLRGIPRHPPLVGVAARVGNDINNQGYTPGPSMAYLMYPVYLAFGRSSIGMLVSNLTLHLVAIWATLTIVRRWSGWLPTLVLAIGVAVMVRALAPRFFLEPWNVWVPVFAFMLFLVLAWGVSEGHHRAIPLLVAVGTHCLQTHISYVPLVGAVLAGVSIHLLVKNRGWGDSQMRRRFVWAVAVLVLMWLPPVIEQFRPNSGNLRRLWDHFTDPPSATVGMKASIKAMIGELNLFGPWINGPGRAPYDAPNVIGFVLFIVLVGSGIVAARHRSEFRRAIVLLAGTTFVGLVATARIFGNFYDYLIRWMWVLALLWSVLSIVVLLSLLRDSVRGVKGHRAFGALVVALVVPVAWGATASAGAEPPYGNDSRLVSGLAPQLEAALPDNDTSRLLRWHDPAALGGTAFGLVLEMEKRGIELGVDPWGGAAARPYRVLDESNADSVLWLIVGPENIERFTQRPDAIQLAAYDPRSAAERDESDELRSRIENRMNALGHPEWIDLLDSQYGHMQILLFTPVPSDLFDLVARYSEIRLPAALFAVPPGAPLFP